MTDTDMQTDAPARQPPVHVRNGEVFASSRDVAEVFSKRHDAVLRDIRNLIRKEPNLGLHNFVEFKNNDLTGDSTSHFEMDRRGFTLLAMGFTGDKALKWKLRYIDAFEAMEAELRSKPLSPAEALLVQVQLMVSIERRNAEIEAKQAAQDLAIEENTGRLNKIATAVGWFTVIGFASFAKETTLDARDAARLGRCASRICKAEGVKPGSVPDERYGRVHSYPKAILEAAWAEIFGSAQ